MPQQSDLTKKIDAILFYLAEPVEVNFLVKTLSVSKDEIVKAIHELKADLENCGVRVVFHNDEVTLVTAPEFSETIEKIVKEEREKDLGRAGVETLAIIAYKGPKSMSFGAFAAYNASKKGSFGILSNCLINSVVFSNLLG